MGNKLLIVFLLLVGVFILALSLLRDIPEEKQLAAVNEQLANIETQLFEAFRKENVLSASEVAEINRRLRSFETTEKEINDLLASRKPGEVIYRRSPGYSGPVGKTKQASEMRSELSAEKRKFENYKRQLVRAMLGDPSFHLPESTQRHLLAERKRALKQAAELELKIKEFEQGKSGQIRRAAAVVALVVGIILVFWIVIAITSV